MRPMWAILLVVTAALIMVVLPAAVAATTTQRSPVIESQSWELPFTKIPN